MSNTKIIIGTHNGKFHADEVLGCFLLRQLPEYKDAVIKRTRCQSELDLCDVVIDVGGIYDHSQKRYDHHQRSFKETLKTVIGGTEGDIKLSSAGLVWAHYGKDIIKSIVKKRLTEYDLSDVYYHLYEFFVKEIDAKDNGIEISDQANRYRIHTDLTSRVSRLNHVSSGQEADEWTQFMKAYDLVGAEFVDAVEDTVNLWLSCKNVVSKALDNRLSIDPSGQILKLESSGIQWGAHLKKLEFEKRIIPDILFVVFPDKNEGWRVQAVSRDGSFRLRRPVLPDYLGLRNEELVSVCGIQEAVFVHATGFIGGAKTYEGALKMAQMSLSNHF